MKTAVITGATSGIGYETCRAILKLRYKVIAIGCTQENCQAALAKLKSEMPDANITFIFGDLMQQRQVHRIADEISALLNNTCSGKLDVLINNAGWCQELVRNHGGRL